MPPPTDNEESNDARSRERAGPGSPTMAAKLARLRRSASAQFAVTSARSSCGL
jgi:hypothetical protein